MTLTPSEIGLYAFALFVLFLTPGPVWVALLARALSGGFRAAWPLAMGVVIGDMLWPFLAILGVSWILSVFSGFLTFVKWVAVLMFFVMGALLIKNADSKISEDSRLTRPGMLAGFLAGLAVIIGNPKAILFYMGLLPGFFELTALTGADIALICFISAAVPFTGNMILGLFVDRIRGFMLQKNATKQLNLIAGGLMILVSFVIAIT